MTPGADRVLDLIMTMTLVDVTAEYRAGWQAAVEAVREAVHAGCPELGLIPVERLHAEIARLTANRDA